MKKIFIMLSCVFILTALITCGDDKKKTSDATTTTVFVVGDSTVCNYDPLDPYYYPRYGYGTQLINFLDSSKIIVNDLALSGRSSKSFATDTTDTTAVANYATLKSSIKKGDYLIIGFGHNDEKYGSLYTNPNTDVTDTSSFQYYLYTYYVKVALDAGATPILCSPITRRSSSGAYTGSTIHNTVSDSAQTTAQPGGDYVAAVKALATAKGVAFVDLTTLTAKVQSDLYSASGATSTANFQAWVYGKSSSCDDTHTNLYGARYYAYLLLNEIANNSAITCSLKSYVTGLAIPELSILVGDANYTNPPSASIPTEANKSIYWNSVSSPWWGSVFGDVSNTGVSTMTTYFDITQVSSTSVSMRSGTTAGATSGKISSTSDGIAFFFQIVPIGKDFTFSATATLNKIYTAHDQVSFGIMVRDGVWIDIADSSLVTNYVACGPLNMTKTAITATSGPYSSFARDTSLSTPRYGNPVSALSVVPTAGAVIPMKIVKSGSTYTVTYGSEAPFTYTVDLGKSEPTNVYVGTFTARSCQVDFSNITLTIN